MRIASGSLLSDMAAWAPERTFRSSSIRVATDMPVSTIARTTQDQHRRADREFDGGHAARVSKQAPERSCGSHLDPYSTSMTSRDERMSRTPDPVQSTPMPALPLNSMVRATIWVQPPPKVLLPFIRTWPLAA